MHGSERVVALGGLGRGLLVARGGLWVEVWSVYANLLPEETRIQEGKVRWGGGCRAWLYTRAQRAGQGATLPKRIWWHYTRAIETYLSARPTLLTAQRQ